MIKYFLILPGQENCQFLCVQIFRVLCSNGIHAEMLQTILAKQLENMHFK